MHEVFHLLLKPTLLPLSANVNVHSQMGEGREKHTCVDSEMNKHIHIINPFLDCLAQQSCWTKQAKLCLIHVKTNLRYPEPRTSEHLLWPSMWQRPWTLKFILIWAEQPRHPRVKTSRAAESYITFNHLLHCATAFIYKHTHKLHLEFA